MIEKFLVCFYSITKKSSSAHLIAPELLFCIHLKFDKLIYVLCISQFLLLTRSNPLATAAVVSVFQLFDQYHILSNVREMAAYLDTRLLKLLEETSLITEIRDLGLMKGIELTVPAAPYIKALQESGNRTGAPDVARPVLFLQICTYFLSYTAYMCSDISFITKIFFSPYSLIYLSMSKYLSRITYQK